MLLKVDRTLEFDRSKDFDALMIEFIKTIKIDLKEIEAEVGNRSWDLSINVVIKTNTLLKGEK